MLVSPSIEIRCVVPFDFVLMVIAASAIGGELQKGIDIGKTAVICITGILGIVNMSDLVCGYHDNMMINTINDSKLREKSIRITAGEDITTIILYKLFDDAYAADVPYQKSFLEFWIKYYYEIPQSVSFVWKDINELGLVREVVTSDMPVIRSIYPDMIDETTKYNEDGSLSMGVTPEVMLYSLKILINGQEYHTVIDKGFVSTAVPKEVLETGYVEINLLDEASGVLSDSFVWIDEDSIK